MPSRSGTRDVLVIGGGPAGSTAATLLAKKRCSVTLLEKEKFPRDHVGESLLPFCYPIFKKLGVLKKLTKTFVRKPGVRFIAIDGRRYTTWCFGHVIKDPSYLSFHVIRAPFDKMLLDNSRANGVDVREQTQVQDVDLDGPDGTVVVRAKGPRGGVQTHRARFLIDASGRDTFLAKRNGWKKPHKDLDRTALSTHWVGGEFKGGIEEGLLQVCYLGGKKKGWIWVIPVSADRLSIGVVLNHSYIRQQKEKLTKRGVKGWKMALYRQELDSSPFVKSVIANARTAMPLMFNGNYSYLVAADKKFGPNFAMVGDASTFLDPIFASGVYLSLNSANLVSAAVHKKLASRNGASLAPLEAAYSQINGAYALANKAIRMFYNPVAISWAEVGHAAELIHERHENALAVGHYLLAGDFFQRHAEYSETLDLLQDPELLRKYKGFVIDRPEFQATTCGLGRVKVFHQLLEEHGVRAPRSRR